MKQTGRAKSMPIGILEGAGISLLITVAFSGMIATAVNLCLLDFNNIGYGVMISLILASYIGCKTAVAMVKRQKMMVSLLTAAVFYCFLILTAFLMFGGNLNGAGESALLILCGCLLSAMTSMTEKKAAAQHKIKKLHR